MSNSSIVVFGASGFIGTQVVSLLEDNRTQNIYAISRRVSLLHGPDVTELLLDEFDLAKHLETYPNTTFLNLVNAYSKERRLSRQELASNLFHPIGIVSQLMDERQVFVQVGTYFEEKEISNYPFSYAWSKRMASLIVLESAAQCGFRGAVVKLFDVYGEGDTRPKVMNLLAQHFSGHFSQQLVLSCPARLIYPVYVGDAISTIMQAVRQPGRTYFATPVEPISLGELVETFQRVSGLNGNVAWSCTCLGVHRADIPSLEHRGESQASTKLEEGIVRMLRSQV